MEKASYNMKPTAPLMARNPRVTAFFTRQRCHWFHHSTTKPRQWCHGFHHSTFAGAHFSRHETDDTTDGASQLQHETHGTTDGTKPSNNGLFHPTVVPLVSPQHHKTPTEVSRVSRACHASRRD